MTLLTVLTQMALSQVASSPELIEVGDPLRQLALPLSEGAQSALQIRDFDAALTELRGMSTDGLSERERGDWAFLVAWSASHTDRAKEAVDELKWLSASSAPAAYVDTAQGIVLLAAEKPKRALESLEKVGPEALPFPRAAVGAAEAHRALGEQEDAWNVVKQVVSRSDPAPGNADALLALATHHGVGSQEALPLLKRLWIHYPDSEAGESAADLLPSYADHQATWQEIGQRAESLMWSELYDRALAETKPVKGNADEASVDGCRLRYVRGRSFYKRNKLTAAVGELGGIGEQCAEVEGTYGPRGLYLLGTAEFRRKRYTSSADVYEKLGEIYSEHSMADDAWTRGGISLLEGGDAAKAAAWWQRALSDHPNGDTVPEAALRLAFWKYDQGRTSEAIEIADKLAALPVSGNAHNIEAGRYWSARWRMYGDATSPTTPTADEGEKTAAIAGWRSLCEDLPHSFYAVLAHARLLEVAPTVAESVAVRADGSTPEAWSPWQIRGEALRDPHFRDGVRLMRLGLSQEGLAQWARSDVGEMRPDEKVWTTELRIAAGDWLFAHDDLRRWIVANPLTTLGPREHQIIRVAYPDRYWDEVQAAVLSEYAYPPRLLHGLVREESNFNREIVSFAGAIGLSQLMWATAQQTAGWMDIEVQRADLVEPAKNLRIGARYLNSLHKQLSTSPYLSLAAYNGGARNVKKWVKEHDNPPVDEWVERIPYRETRGYVKRVMGTWQTMRVHLDDGPLFSDLSSFNHQAFP